MTNASCLATDHAGDIVTFSISDSLGDFTIINSKALVKQIECSFLGYRTLKIDIDHDFHNDTLLLGNLIMSPSENTLSEIIVKSTRIIKKEKTDTISINADAYHTDRTIVLEDLLKKIPGIQVSQAGHIKIEGKEIKKIIVEGDDLLGEDYLGFSRSFPSQAIKTIEVIRNYEDNRLLSVISNSDDLAINIKLKKEYYSVWFGSAELAIDGFGDHQYDVKGTIGNISPKTKNWSTAAVETTGVSSQKINDQRQELSSAGLLSDKLSPLIDIGSTVNLSRSGLASLPGQSSGVSTNFLFKPSDGLELTLSADIKDEETLVVTNGAINYITNDNIAFFNTTTDSTNSVEMPFEGFVKVEYNINDNSIFNFKSDFGVKESMTLSQSSINDFGQTESLSNNQLWLNPSLSYYRMIDDTSLLQCNIDVYKEDVDQSYTIRTPYFLNDITSADNNVIQGARMENHGFNANLKYSTRRNKNNYDWELRYSRAVSGLLSNFVTTTDFLLSLDNNVANDIRLKNNNVSIAFSFKRDRKNRKIELFSSLDFVNQWRNQQEKFNTFLFNFNGSIEFRVKERVLIEIDAHHDTKMLPVSDMYEGYIMLGSSTFSSNLHDRRYLRTSNIIFKTTYGRLVDDLQFSFLFRKTYFHSYLTSDSRIVNEYQLRRVFDLSGRSSHTGGGEIRCFLNNLDQNLEYKLEFSQLSYNDIVNDVNRKVNHRSIINNISLASLFAGPFNYDISYGIDYTSYNLSDNEITNIFGKLNSEIYFAFNSYFCITANLNYIHYYDVGVPFSIFNCRLNLNVPNSKFSVSADFRNLTDSRLEVSRFAGDTFILDNSNVLLGRQLLIKAKLNF